MLRRLGMIVALTVLALGCVIGSVGMFIPARHGYSVRIGNGGVGIGTDHLIFFLPSQSIVPIPNTLAGLILIVPAAFYIVWQWWRSRKRIARGFPMDEV